MEYFVGVVFLAFSKTVKLGNLGLIGNLIHKQGIDLHDNNAPVGVCSSKKRQISE